MLLKPLTNQSFVTDLVTDLVNRNHQLEIIISYAWGELVCAFAVGSVVMEMYPNPLKI